MQKFPEKLLIKKDGAGHHVTFFEFIRKLAFDLDAKIKNRIEQMTKNSLVFLSK